MVRAKFVVASKVADVNSHTSQITLYAVTSGCPENDSFFKYTPFGQINISTINNKAAEEFVLGKEMYVDFINCERTPMIADDLVDFHT